MHIAQIFQQLFVQNYLLTFSRIYVIIIIESEEKAMTIEELINYNFDIEEYNLSKDNVIELDN